MKIHYTFKSKYGNLVTHEKDVADENHMNNFIKYLVEKKHFDIVDFGVIETLKK